MLYGSCQETENCTPDNKYDKRKPISVYTINETNIKENVKRFILKEVAVQFQEEYALTNDAVLQLCKTYSWSKEVVSELCKEFPWFKRGVLELKNKNYWFKEVLSTLEEGLLSSEDIIIQLKIELDDAKIILESYKDNDVRKICEECSKLIDDAISLNSVPDEEKKSVKNYLDSNDILDEDRTLFEEARNLNRPLVKSENQPAECDKQKRFFERIDFYWKLEHLNCSIRQHVNNFKNGIDIKSRINEFFTRVFSGILFVLDIDSTILQGFNAIPNVLIVVYGLDRLGFSYCELTRRDPGMADDYMLKLNRFPFSRAFTKKLKEFMSNNKTYQNAKTCYEQNIVKIYRLLNGDNAFAYISNFINEETNVFYCYFIDLNRMIKILKEKGVGENEAEMLALNINLLKQYGIDIMTKTGFLKYILKIHNAKVVAILDDASDMIENYGCEFATFKTNDTERLVQFYFSKKALKISEINKFKHEYAIEEFTKEHSPKPLKSSKTGEFADAKVRIIVNNLTYEITVGVPTLELQIAMQNLIKSSRSTSITSLEVHMAEEMVLFHLTKSSSNDLSHSDDAADSTKS